MQNFGFKPGLQQRALNKERVIILFDVIVLHDVHERTRMAVLPRAGKFFQQTFRRIVAVTAVTVLHPLFED